MNTKKILMLTLAFTSPLSFNTYAEDSVNQAVKDGNVGDSVVRKAKNRADNKGEMGTEHEMGTDGIVDTNSRTLNPSGQTGDTQNTSNSALQKSNNSGVNKRYMGKNAKTLTPPDQSRGTAQDVELTRRIRELVTSEDSFSTSAQNVKIVTISGIATLRGPVASAQEKTRIAKIASDVLGGSTFVRDQLEVKTEKASE